MALFAVNATVVPEGSSPILLVFGSMTRPARTGPSITQIYRVRSIDSAIKEVEWELAIRRIAFGLRHSGGPKANESSDNTILHELPVGSPILVNRLNSNRWEGPHKLISVNKVTVVIQTDR